MRKPIIVALDMHPQHAREMLIRLDPALCRVKIGMELFTRTNQHIVEDAIALGFDVFLDLKYHDIPNTVRGACWAAADIGAWMVNVHASGGPRMLKAAVEGVAKSQRAPLLIAVTNLTSMDAPEMRAIGCPGDPSEHAVSLARLAHGCGLDGVVCSPLETFRVREACGEGFVIVNPGIRPAGAGVDDQKRVGTPFAAKEAGAHYLVIGRPVTAADDPIAALTAIQNEIS